MRQALFTIAPEAPFLATLATRVLDGTLLSGWDRAGPFWLADVTIIVPTRRARLALADCFARAGHGLLPDIRTLGGDVADEEPFLPPFESAPLPPAASALERRLVLAELVDKWARTPGGAEALSSPPSAAEALWLADALGQLIDDLAIEGVPASALRGLAEGDLATNWAQTLAFLDIALEVWPQILAGRGKADGATLRNERLNRQAAAAPLMFGDRPVIAAGSTGSIPATADLLASIALLPRGALVLPGLDTGLARADLDILTDVARAPHGHSQFGLVQLLRRLGQTPAGVLELTPEAVGPRTLAVRRALAPADATDGWARQRGEIDLDAASAGLTVLVARNEDEEARAIALVARDGLADGQSVAIVTPDRNLARRIAAELGRFEIVIDDAAGTPLFHTPAGRLVRKILAVAQSELAPVDLMALLRNRGTRLGRERAELSRLAGLVEMGLLRGQRLRPGLVGLNEALAGNLAGTGRPARKLSAAEGVGVERLLDDLAGALAPLGALLGTGRFGLAQLVATLDAALMAVIADEAGASPTDLPGLDDWQALAAEMAERSGDGPPIGAVALDAVLAALMAGRQLRPSVPLRDDIAIWGTLEARLQSADLTILAGLNEDVWPEAADPGPWLSRGMRLAAGLEPPERRAGLAAHDFEMAMGAPALVLALAERLGKGPAIASRLVQRIEAFWGENHAKALRQRGAAWLEQARALDRPAAVVPAPRPAPNPPAAVRPRRLSVTAIETLMRSPYDIYAKHVLGLYKLDPLGEAPGGRERGTLTHDVFANFVIGGHDFAAPDALDTLTALAREAFSGLDAIGERRDIWLARFATAAQRFLDWERARSGLVAVRHAEIEGRWTFPALEGFSLTGRADRVDLMVDGTLEIIDFKTGSLPAATAMKTFEAPQLLLEAAMAQAGALAGVAPAPTSALTYIKIALGPDAFNVTPFKLGDGRTVMDAADEASRRMQRHVDALLLKDRAMAAHIRPDSGRRYAGDYDHLARAPEWLLRDDSEQVLP